MSACLQQLPGFNITDFSSVLWGLAVLDCEPPEPWLETFVAGLEDALVAEEECNTAVLSRGLWALAKLEYVPGPRLKAALQQHIPDLLSRIESAKADGTGQSMQAEAVEPAAGAVAKRKRGRPRKQSGAVPEPGSAEPRQDAALDAAAQAAMIAAALPSAPGGASSTPGYDLAMLQGLASWAVARLNYRASTQAVSGEQSQAGEAGSSPAALAHS